MYAEINQALEALRQNGSLLSTEWPEGAPVTPAELDLVEQGGRLVRVEQVEELDLAYLRQAAENFGLEALIEYYPVVDSTNGLLVQRAKSGVLSNLLVTCDYQHAGRGRRGRNWVSPYGRNLAFSLLIAREKPCTSLVA